MRRTNSATLVVVLVASFFAAKVAQASVLCCEMANGALCFWSSTGSCPGAAWDHQYMSVAVPNSNPTPALASVAIQLSGTYEGLCFSHTSGITAGNYAAPDTCVRLTPPPLTGLGPLVQVSESFVPWEGNAFAFEVPYNFAAWFSALYMSCYSGTTLRDEVGFPTRSFGAGYTCGPLKPMTWNTAGVHSANFHFFPSVNTAPTLGVQPRLTATYGGHLVGHYDNFVVRTATPNAAVEWHRTANGVVKPVVTLGITDAWGVADVWFPPWASTDVGTNTLYVHAGSIFTSNTLTFTVQ